MVRRIIVVFSPQDGCSPDARKDTESEIDVELSFFGLVTLRREQHRTLFSLSASADDREIKQVLEEHGLTDVSIVGEEDDEMETA